MAPARPISYSVLSAFVLAGVRLGSGLSLVLAGESLEAHVEDLVNGDHACVGENCTTLAPANECPEYQQGPAFVVDGITMGGLGVVAAAFGGSLWRPPPKDTASSP